jgi:hypothetical protein
MMNIKKKMFQNLDWKDTSTEWEYEEQREEISGKNYSL